MFIDKTQTGSNCQTLWGRSTVALNEYIMTFDDNLMMFSVFISYETENSRFSIEQIFQNITIFSRTEILPTTSSIQQLLEVMLLSLQKRSHRLYWMILRSVLRMLGTTENVRRQIKQTCLRVISAHLSVKCTQICIPFPPDSWIFSLLICYTDPLCYHRNTQLSRIPKFHLHLGSVI